MTKAEARDLMRILRRRNYSASLTSLPGDSEGWAVMVILSKDLGPRIARYSHILTDLADLVGMMNFEALK